MRRGASALGRLALAVLLVVVLPKGLRAQVPDTVRPKAPVDTLARDTTRRDVETDSLRRILTGDTLPPDTTARRAAQAPSAPDATARWLAFEAMRFVRVDVLPRIDGEGPRPPSARLVFTRDSIDLAGAETVSDLLARVPGVFIWRAGFVGRAELPTYQARGSTAVEYTLDGVPYLALGPDSVAVDASLFSVSLLDRIEVERWPGFLRVHLFTRRHDRLAVRSILGVATGSGQYARYQASLEQRTRGGFGYALAADYLNSGLDPSGLDAYRNTQVFGQLSWLPSPTFGTSLQLIRSRPNRTEIPGTAPGAELGFKGTRSDLQARLGLHSRGLALSGVGSSVDLLLNRSAWDDSVLAQHVYQAGAVASLRGRRTSVDFTGFYRNRWTPVDLRLTGGWSTGGALTAFAEGGYRHHDGGRSSRWVGVHLGLRLPYDLTIGAAGRVGRIVAAPSITTDTAQAIADGQVSLSWDRPRIGFELVYGSNDKFVPEGFQPFFAVPNLAPNPRTRWLSAAGHLAPVPGIFLEGWFTTPRPVTAIGQPPALAVSRATFQSKFLRVFPSGIFTLKLQLSLERWSSGILGFDPAGNAVRTPRTLFYRSLVELRLGGVVGYWEQANLTAGAKAYVPGYAIPQYTRVLGVRWEFAN